MPCFAQVRCFDDFETKPMLWVAKQLHFFLDIFFLATTSFYSAFSCKNVTDKCIKVNYVFRVYYIFIQG